MPAAHSYEWNAEELVMKKLQRSAFLAAKTMRHWEDRMGVVLDAIVVRAQKEEVNLDGVQGYSMVVSCAFQTTIMSAADSDALALNVSREMYKVDAGFAPGLTDLYFVSLEPETKTDRTNTAKLRKWTVAFPLIIKLID